jgi:hypothetical protein
MQINLPQIEGTSFDGTLNELIDSVNNYVNPDQQKFAAHAAAAITRFLMEFDKLKGEAWLRKARPLVDGTAVNPPLVDNMYEQLVKLSIIRQG